MPATTLAMRIAAHRRRHMGYTNSNTNMLSNPYWHCSAAPNLYQRKNVAFIFRAIGVHLILPNLQDGFTACIFLAVLLSVPLLLFVLNQVLGLDGIFTDNSINNGMNMYRPGLILLKAVSDFGAVAAGLYYVILYHSRAEIYY